MATLTQIQTRYAYLIGESSTTNLTAVDTSHINAAVKDICNRYPFSWNLTTETLTLSSGTSNLATNYNPDWHLNDARISNTGTGNDNVFTEITVAERDSYSSDDYVYWITFNTSTERYIFNSQTQSGSVVTYYQFIPTDLSTGAQVCIVPDGEAVAYLAASKNWIGDERNITLKQEYEQEAEKRIASMIQRDVGFGPALRMGSIVDSNAQLRRDAVSDLRIYKPY